VKPVTLLAHLQRCHACYRSPFGDSVLRYTFQAGKLILQTWNQCSPCYVWRRQSDASGNCLAACTCLPVLCSPALILLAQPLSGSLLIG
jgi:hypothetical protein